MFNIADPNSARLASSFSDPEMTASMLDSMVKSYMSTIKSGSWSSAGLPDCAYSVSKLAVNDYSLYDNSIKSLGQQD